MNQKLRLLICTNGSEASRPALEYGAWIADKMDFSVTLLGLIEDPNDQLKVEELVEVTSKRLDNLGAAYQTRLERGSSIRIISAITQEKQYLTVVGPFGRSVLHLVVYGRTFRKLLAAVETPILYVPEVCLPMRRILLCMGGLGYAKGVENISLFFARMSSAEVIMLHVIEPVTLNYPTSREITEHKDNLLGSHTPQGENLRQALENFRSAGVTASLKLRHGNPIHEIQEEITKGDYDLISLGSAYSTHSLRHLYLPNVTADIAEVSAKPLLTARENPDFLLSGAEP
jgi:nucleotide-binding universal stress UspA family protein